MERLHARAARGAPLSLDRLAAGRRDASDTLRRGYRIQSVKTSATDAWDRASRKLSDWLVDGRPIELSGIDALAAMVLGEPDSSGNGIECMRTVRMFNGPSEYAPPECVAALHAAMQERLLSRVGESHPIVEGALATRWLVSVHPYRDGNGRTSRLLADWILGAAGYMPASYSNPVEAFVACRFEKPDARNPLSAIQVVARGVERSVALLEVS